MMYNQEGLLHRFVAYLTTLREASWHTLIAYKVDLMQFVDYLAGYTDQQIVVQVTKNDIRGWIVTLARKGLDACSINRKISAIRRFYTYLQSIKGIASN